MVPGSQGAPYSSSALTSFPLSFLLHQNPPIEFQCRGVLLFYFLAGAALSAGGNGHFWLISEPFPCWGRHGKQIAVAQLRMKVQERDVKEKQQCGGNVTAVLEMPPLVSV